MFLKIHLPNSYSISEIKQVLAQNFNLSESQIQIEDLQKTYTEKEELDFLEIATNNFLKDEDIDDYDYSKDQIKPFNLNEFLQDT